MEQSARPNRLTRGLHRTRTLIRDGGNVQGDNIHHASTSNGKSYMPLTGNMATGRSVHPRVGYNAFDYLCIVWHCTLRQPTQPNVSLARLARVGYRKAGGIFIAPSADRGRSDRSAPSCCVYRTSGNRRLAAPSISSSCPCGRISR